MSTSAVTFPSASRLPGRRYDRVFFPILAALILVTVFVGFARTYFLAGMINAPLPNWIVHVHGALFSTWIVLLMVQIGFVSARRVDLHKKLGLFGFGLACVMVIFGMLAARSSLMRGFTPPNSGLDPRTFFVVPVTAMVLFSTFLYFGWKLRTDSAAHKRLMMLATISLLGAAIARWPFGFIRNGTHVAADLSLYAFLLLMAGYDLWSTHKVQRATLWGGLLIIVAQQISVPIAMTPPWLRLAEIVAGKF